MYAISILFLGFLFKNFIGSEAMDLVKLPPGANWALGTIHGAGTVVIDNGLKMLQIPLWRSFLAGNSFIRHCPLYSNGLGLGLLSEW